MFRRGNWACSGLADGQKALPLGATMALLSMFTVQVSSAGTLPVGACDPAEKPLGADKGVFMGIRMWP